MIVYYHRRFNKELDKRPLKIRLTFLDREALWLKDPRHPLLDDHRLNAPYEGCRSFNVSGDLRVIYRLQPNTDSVLFLRFGTHAELYSK